MKIIRLLLILGITGFNLYRVRVMLAFAGEEPAPEARPVGDPRPLAEIVREQNAYLARQI